MQIYFKKSLKGTSAFLGLGAKQHRDHQLARPETKRLARAVTGDCRRIKQGEEGSVAVYFFILER
jgi:hypothetical protein